MTIPNDWKAQSAANRANWDERVAIHLKAESYEMDSLRAGHAKLHTIEEAELGSVDGLKVLHLQCHFGRDSLILASKGADVTGLDFSPPAIEAARTLAKELGLEGHARFVEADLYDAPNVIPEAASFDRVFVTWGATVWLHDIRRWAQIVAHFLKPGGSLYVAEGHPSAFVFDSAVPGTEKFPAGPYAPYFWEGAFLENDSSDYADDSAKLTNTKQYSWCHSLSDKITALIDAGLTLRFLHEHDCVPWPMFDHLVKGDDGMYRWPKERWLPLAYSLKAAKPVS
jgi:SAM-dependent methyltransferase